MVLLVASASAANAVVDGIRRLTFDTPVDEVFSVGLHSQGEYEIDKGLIYSMPCRVKHGQLEIVTSFEHNAFGQEKIRLVLEELRQEYEAVKALGLL